MSLPPAIGTVAFVQWTSVCLTADVDCSNHSRGNGGKHHYPTQRNGAESSELKQPVNCTACPAEYGEGTYHCDLDAKQPSTYGVFK